MQWLLAGICYAFFNAVVILVNQKFQMNAFMLGMWRGFGAALVAIMLINDVPAPQAKMFFIMAVVQGVLVGYYDFKLFSSAAKYGASATSLLTVFAIVISILAWWALDFARFKELLENPKVFFGIVISLSCCIGGYIFLVDSKITRPIFKFMLPAIIVLAAMTINTKFIYADAPFETAIIYYVLIIGVIGGTFNLSGFFFQQDKDPVKDNPFSRNNLLGGICMVIASLLLMACKGVAMRTIPNPGFLNILALTSPLWIVLINRFLKVDSKIHLPAAIFVIVSMAFLVYFSNIPLQPMPY